MIRFAVPILLALAACSNEPPPPPPAGDRVTPALEMLAAKADPGTLGVALLDLDTGAATGVNADKPMPMQSVFKLPLAIVVLDAVDRGALSLDDVTALTQAQLSIAHSPIAETFPEKTDYTVEELIRAAVAQSDNTAADVLMKRIGGPDIVTRFFQQRGLGSFRLDRYESELQPQLVGLPPFAEAQAGVPVETQRASLRIYLADPRDRVSPADMARILAMLAKGRLLSEASTAKLMAILESTTTGADRLKAGAPAGATVYHKTGTGPTVDRIASAVNDVGVIALPDGRRVAVAAFLAGSDLPPDERAAILAATARLATTEFVPPAAEARSNPDGR